MLNTHTHNTFQTFSILMPHIARSILVSMLFSKKNRCSHKQFKWVFQPSGITNKDQQTWTTQPICIPWVIWDQYLARSAISHVKYYHDFHFGILNTLVRLLVISTLKYHEVLESISTRSWKTFIEFAHWHKYYKTICISKKNLAHIWNT
jgi:hypothetical protein